MKLERLLEEWRNEWHRLAGGVFGPPGTGKTTFLRLVEKYLPSVYIATKDCKEGNNIEVDAKVVFSKISTVLHYMADVAIKPSLDRLSVAMRSPDPETLKSSLLSFDLRVREWLEPKVQLLLSLTKDSSVMIPTCLSNMDEPMYRLTLGLLYASRRYIPRLVILDDLLGFIVEERRIESFVAMMRPLILAVNHFPDTREMMMFNPAVVTPGGYPSRVARPDRYVVIWDGRRYEIKRDEVLRLLK